MLLAEQGKVDLDAPAGDNVKALAKAKIAFIGPDAFAIHAMGDKMSGLAGKFGTIGVALSAKDPAYEDEIGLLLGLFGMVTLIFFAPSFFGGIGLLRGVPWARAFLWIQSAGLALMIPVGTLIAGLNLWVLVATREISADGGVAKFEAFVYRAIRPLILMLIALFIPPRNALAWFAADRADIHE